MSRLIDAVLLIAFGGPTAPHEIRPFLANVTKGRPIPPERIEAVAHHYEAIGGRSPLNELTLRQAQALQALLRRDGPDLPVYVGMRNWTPYLHETLAEMAEKGVRRAIGLILSSFQAEASWGRYQNDVAEARLRVGSLAPQIEYAPPWFDQAGFIDATVERVKKALGQIPPADWPGARLIFTAHSIPTAMAEVSPYASQFVLASRLTASRVGHAKWSIAYQSRSGSPREPWLEPDIADVIRECAREGARHVVAAPIGFVCDHVEVLYDLDVEARRVAEAGGVSFLRAAAVNDHPAFIRMLRDLVAETVNGGLRPR